jgi:hypothetical protein
MRRTALHRASEAMILDVRKYGITFRFEDRLIKSPALGKTKMRQFASYPECVSMIKRHIKAAQYKKQQEEQKNQGKLL